MLRCIGAAHSDSGESQLFCVTCSEAAARYVKCVAVGDSSTGKTCLLVSYARNSFSEDYVPTVFDNINADILIDGNAFNLSLWDTAGQEEYNRLRPLSFRGTDVFLVLFSLISKVSYENVQKKWVPELRHHAGSVPIVLVGTMLDMREDKHFFMNHPDLEPISTSQGEELKMMIGAVAYIECSAKTQQNLVAVFNSVIKAALCKPKSKKSNRKQSGCSIL
ncbi:hypothetical protein EJB05_15788, partial [Eragrostis curvula]